MLRPFAHPVARCCVLLGVVGQSLKPENSFSGLVQRDATTPNIVGSTMLRVVACVLAVVYKRMQQLPTMLGQQP